MPELAGLERQSQKMNLVAWLVCVIAAIGFLFDTYELLMLPLVIQPAMLELGKLTPGTPDYAAWAGRLFFIPAIAGGIFGLLGGYLTDRLGRRRVLTYSILLYAVSAFCAGFAKSLLALLIFRTTTFIGVCVEFVAAVAWLAELFPSPKQRERVLGYTQALGSLGGILVTGVNYLVVRFAAGGTAPWRYTLMSGLIPAIPLILIRPFLPESPAWAEKRAAGTLRRPRLMELFQPKLARTTVVTTLIMACGFGAAFGAIQQLPQIVRGLPEVTAEAKRLAEPRIAQAIAKQTAGKPAPQATEIAAKVKAQLTQKSIGEVTQKYAPIVQQSQEFGGLAGRIVLAVLATIVVARRRLLRIFQVPGLIVMPIVFGICAVTGVKWLAFGAFFAGFCTVAQFSFWGNYLPRVYPVHLRGTGESFAANIGGRVIGTSMALLTQTIAVKAWVPGAGPAAKLAYTAAGVGFAVYLIGLAASFWLPEPGLEGSAE